MRDEDLTLWSNVFLQPNFVAFFHYLFLFSVQFFWFILKLITWFFICFVCMYMQIYKNIYIDIFSHICISYIHTNINRKKWRERKRESERRREVLLNWTFVRLPAFQQSKFTDTRLCSVYCRAHQGEQAAHAEKTWTPRWLSGRVFKGKIWCEGCRVQDFLLIGWWWGSRMVFRDLNHQSSGSYQSGVYVLVLSMSSTSSTWVGS